MARLSTEEEYHLVDSCLQKAQEKLEASMGQFCRQSWAFFPSVALGGFNSSLGPMHATSDPHLHQAASQVFSTLPPPLADLHHSTGGFFRPQDGFGFPSYPGFPAFHAEHERNQTPTRFGREQWYSHEDDLESEAGFHDDDTLLGSFSGVSSPQSQSATSTPRSRSATSTPRYRSNVTSPSSSKKCRSNVTSPQYQSEGGRSEDVSFSSFSSHRFASPERDFSSPPNRFTDSRRSHSFSFPQSDFGGVFDRVKSPEEHFRGALHGETPFKPFEPKFPNLKSSFSHDPLVASAFPEEFQHIPKSAANFDELFDHFSSRGKPFKDLGTLSAPEGVWVTREQVTKPKPPRFTGTNSFTSENFHASDKNFHSSDNRSDIPYETVNDFFTSNTGYPSPFNSTNIFQSDYAGTTWETRESVKDFTPLRRPPEKPAAHYTNFSEVNSYQRDLNQNIPFESKFTSEPVPKTEVKFKPVINIVTSQPVVPPEDKFQAAKITAEPVIIKTESTSLETKEAFNSTEAFNLVKNSRQEKPVDVIPPFRVKVIPETKFIVEQKSEPRNANDSISSEYDLIDTKPPKVDKEKVVSSAAIKSKKNQAEQETKGGVTFRVKSNKHSKSKNENRRHSIAVFRVSNNTESQESTTYEEVTNTIDDLLKSLTEVSGVSSTSNSLTRSQVNKSAPSLNKKPLSPIVSETSAFKPYKRPLSDYILTPKSLPYNGSQERCFRHIESPPYDNSDELKTIQSVNVVHNESKFESFTSITTTLFSSQCSQSLTDKLPSESRPPCVRSAESVRETQPLHVRVNQEVPLRPVPCFYVRSDGPRRHSYSGSFASSYEEMSVDVCAVQKQDHPAFSDVDDDDTLNNSPDDDYDGSASDGVDTLNSSVLGDEEHDSSFGDDEDGGGSDEAPPLPPRTKDMVTEKRAPVLLIPPPPPPNPNANADQSDVNVCNNNNVDSEMCKEFECSRATVTGQTKSYKNIAEFADLDVDSSEGEWQSACDVPGCRDPLCALEAEGRTLPRKVSMCPSMPAIIEDAHKDEDEDEDDEEVQSVTAEASYSDVGTLKSSSDGSLRRGELVNSPRWVDGICMSSQPQTPTPTVTPPPTPNQSPCSTLPRSPSTLLDSMHRKFYPTQYKYHSGSTESLPSPKPDPLCDSPSLLSQSANLQDLQAADNCSSPTETKKSESKSSKTKTSFRQVPETSVAVYRVHSDLSRYPKSPLLGSKSPALLRATMTPKLPVTPNQNGTDVCEPIVVHPLSPKSASTIRTSPTFKMNCFPISCQSHSPTSPAPMRRPFPNPNSPTLGQSSRSLDSNASHFNRSLSAPGGTENKSEDKKVDGSTRAPTPPIESVQLRRHNHGDSPSPQARRTVQAILNKIEKDAAETEASEACKWLRAAGFPQYAQMYEDHQFPIDIKSVISDHDFLDEDSIQSLIRRLNTLNKCATMRIEAPVHRLGDDSDEEEQCALSDRWQFQRNIQRWSRKDLDSVTVLPSAGLPSQADAQNTLGLRSCSSHDSVITDNDSIHQDESPELKSRQESKLPSPPPSPFSMGYKEGCGSSPSVSPEGEPPSNLHKENSWEFPWSPRLRRAASERFKGAKNFLKRMESFKGKKSSKRGRHPPDRLAISGPVVSDDVLMRERMERLGCVDISPSSESSPSSFGPYNTYDSVTEKPPLSPLSNGHQGPALYRSGSESCHSPTSNTSDSPDLHANQRTGNMSRKNHSSSDITDINKKMESTGHGRSSGFPKVLSSGFVDMGHGNQVNVRTGSFSQGCDRVSYSGVGQVTSDHRPRSDWVEVVRTPSRISPCREENRLSFYDNVPGSGTESHQELDLILSDLLENIQELGGGPLSRNIPSKQETPSEESSVPMVMVEVVDPEKQSNGSRVGFHCPAQVLSRTPSQHSRTPSQTSWTPHHSRTPSQHSNRSQVSQTSKQSSISRESPSRRPSHGNKVAHFEEEGEDRSSVTGSLSNPEVSDADTHGSRDEDTPDVPDSPEPRERRDSGVGSSLTRAPSDRRRHRIRWHSFVKSHRPSLNSQSLQLWNMSAGQLMVLRKLSLLKVTAIMERYSPSNRSGWNWIVPKLMRRWKVPDYKDKNVFGVPLLVIQQRSGQPLPQCMLYAMRSLRRTAKDAVGIFRKSGVRSRIQKLRNQIESDPESVDFENLQAYDVADLFKQYFRELPECLLTNKLSDTFITMFTHVPQDMRLEALQAAVMLLPDENRHVLQSLLLFLSDLAQHSSENQMTASNLAVCFAPSLFHICGSNRSNPAASPKWGRKASGIPDQKELQEQKAAHECLNTMIAECKYIFMAPEEMLSKCRLSYIEQGDPVAIHELGKRRSDGSFADYTAYIDTCIQGLLKEARDKFKGWVSVSGIQNGTDLAYKKVGDGHPLRLWKCSADVEAPPFEVLNRILRERHVWDEDLLKWRIVEKLPGETEVFQYITNSMAPHPTRDFVELRSWRTDLAKGACVLVSTSVEHSEAPLIGGIRGVGLASRYLIEPCGSGKSRLTHICRIDLRGHTPEWYNKAYGHIASRYIVRIRDSFHQGITSDGPETKV